MSAEDSQQIGFRLLYERYSGMVYRYVLAKTGKVEAAEDILQEVFLGLWRHPKKLPHIQAYRSWIFRIAHNKVVDYYRQARLRTTLGSESNEYQNLAARRSAHDDLPLDESDLAKASKGLNGEKQKLLDLIYYFGLTYEEAARLIGISLGTLKSRLHNLRSSLKTLAGQPSRVMTGAQKRKQCAVYNTPAVLYSLPGMGKVKVANVPFLRSLTMDIYYPSDFDFKTALPVVVLAMGYSNEGFMKYLGKKLKDLMAYPSWGQLIAASGMVAIAYETDDPDQDIHAIMDFISRKGRFLGLDGTRICIWASSGNVMTALQVLTETQRPYASFIKCGVLYYPVFTDLQKPVVDVNAVLRKPLRTDLPLLLVEVGKEQLEYKPGAELFIQSIRSGGMPLEHIYYEEGVHRFDLYMDNVQTHEIVGRTIEFIYGHVH
jgi:RNA polymerase sigma factor (sigma-70 family)